MGLAIPEAVQPETELRKMAESPKDLGDLRKLQETAQVVV
jgi:hypothetical protein